jgi:hypothetical protein
MDRNPIPSPQTLKHELALLYKRRAALDRLIESLERYSETLRTARADRFPPARTRHAAVSRVA